MEISVPSPPPSETDANPFASKSTKPSPKPKLKPLEFQDDEGEDLPAKITDAPRHPDLGYGTPDCFLWCWQNLSRHAFRTLYGERRQEMREKCRGIAEATEPLQFLKPSTKTLP